MKVLVVYYSRDGHTRTVAKEIVAAIESADLYEIKELQSRAGIVGGLLACKDAILKKITAIEASTIDPSNYDYVIIGTPVWAFTMPSAVRSWITQHGKTLKNTMFFVTMGGSGDQRTFSHMTELCINKPLLTASFIDKEIDKGAYKQKLDSFVAEIKQKLGSITISN